MENTEFNGKSALDYVKYLLNDSETNNRINYSELREELDTSTFESDTFNKNKYYKNNNKELDYAYFKEEKDEFSTEYEEYISKINTLKNDIILLKKELLEEKNNNKVLQEENKKLKQSLQKTNIENEKKNTMMDDRYPIKIKSRTTNYFRKITGINDCKIYYI
ncbi:hypothetical protein PIROE2DRAFT_5502 [Piromyces sp. E2]|nr:hypothetical protein PIROE2DRAFT_5502 [Piromyces sp. E2]|eukprot:OUM67122.1 hypothetical protein PIROE2DRAFT_5502 [Piromyces sp. E2]